MGPQALKTITVDLRLHSRALNDNEPPPRARLVLQPDYETGCLWIHLQKQVRLFTTSLQRAKVIELRDALNVWLQGERF